MVGVIYDEDQTLGFGELLDLLTHCGGLVVAHEPYIPRRLRLPEQARELERETTFAATRGRGQQKHPFSRDHRIDDLALPPLIADVRTPEIEQRMPWRFVQEYAVVALPADKGLRLGLPVETIPQLCGEQRSSRRRTNGL